MRSASAANTGWDRLGTRLRTQGLAWGLGVAILALQYPLWLGEGGWLRVRAHARAIEAQQTLNRALQTRNASLQAELGDLKQGRDAIEERARSELGMIATDEWFVRVVAAQSVQAR
ncbi:MAG: cell division protein FtsB [Rubrivivax sp.]|nr:cell division protein FtsB [Rubrivivax sp.]